MQLNRLENELFATFYTLMEDAGKVLTVANASIRNAIYNSSVGDERADELLRLATSDYVANRRK